MKYRLIRIYKVELLSNKIYKFREYFSSSDERRSCHRCHFKLKKRNNFACNFSLIKYTINLLHIFVLFDILDL